MNTIHPLVLEVRRLASSLSSNLVRQHIEHIDFDAYAKEFEVNGFYNLVYSGQV
jgi:hypothetical protein